MGAREIKVQLIGNYLRSLVEPLKEYGIVCGEIGSIIDGCSVLAMEDEPNIEIQTKYIFSPPYDQNIFTVGSLMNLQKNLSVRLSRMPERYRQCIQFDVRNKSDRTKNDSDYIIIFNSTMGCDLYEKDDMVFSDLWPQNRFTKDIKTDSSYRSIKFPFPNSFNWKYYYDKFINAILQQYDCDHIILVRLNSAQWFMNKSEICAFERKSTEWRNRIEEVDNYFAEKTNCLCIDELYNYIPQQKKSCAFPYGYPGSLVYAPLARRISEVIAIDKKNEHFHAISSENTFVKCLRDRLSSDILDGYAEKIEYIEKRKLSLKDICEQNKEGGQFSQNIRKLQKFLHPENKYTLSDCVVEWLENKEKLINKVDMEEVQIYTQYMKLDINDIIAVYVISIFCDNKEPFRKVIENVLKNTDALPVSKALKFRDQNLDFLKAYPYIQLQLIENVKRDTLFIELGKKIYLRLNPNSEVAVSKIKIGIKDKIDFKQVFDNGFCCDILSAGALCANYEFYLERTKQSLSGRPITIYFKSQEDFEDSLYYINYPDLLNSERFVITQYGSEFLPSLKDYKSIVDIGDIVQSEVDFSCSGTIIEESAIETLNYLHVMGQLHNCALNQNSSDKQSVHMSKILTGSLQKDNDVLKKNCLLTSIKAIIEGFSIANKRLSTDEATHYFLKVRHLGDNVRGATFLKLFRDYHIKNKTFPVKKMIVLTTSNNRDLMLAYGGVDEVIVFTKEELYYLEEYATSSICIHNLYNDSFRLLKSWGSPNLCDIYKISEDYLRQNPEMVRFPDKLADISRENAKKFLDKHDIRAEETVVIIPYAQSSGDITHEMFHNIIGYFNKIGYTVFTNTGLGEKALENTISLTETADVVLAMASMGTIMIGIQNGIMDALEWLDINIKFIFVSILEARENIRMFYNAAKLIFDAPAPHDLSKRIERRKGAVSICVSTEEERKHFDNDVIELSKIYIKGNLQSSTCSFTNKLSIYSQPNLNDYIAEAVKLSHIVILISVCDSADRYWNKFECRNLLGLKMDLSKDRRLSYLAVIDVDNGICDELISDKWNGVNRHYSFIDVRDLDHHTEVYGDEIEHKYGEMPLENYCWIYSCAMDKQKYTKSNIVINGIDYSVNRRGLNIVIYSKEEARVIDSINVDTFNDPKLTVNRIKDFGKAG